MLTSYMINMAACFAKVSGLYGSMAVYNLSVKLGLLFLRLNIWQHILFSFGFSRHF